MEKIEKSNATLALSAADLNNLCGPLDENLRQIEVILGVKIQRRGHQLTVDGEQSQRARAIRAVHHFSGVAQATGQAVSPNEIQLYFVSRTDDDMDGAEGIVLKTKKRDLQGRTPNQRAYIQAVDAFERGLIERIVLTRPAVEAGERLGFLPGDLSQKVDPYLRPLYDALFDLLGFEKSQRLIEKHTIEIAPLAYMRGRTLNNSFIILDEAQNTTPEQMKMFLTRIGFGSKAVITGDMTQVDLPRGVPSGLRDAVGILEGVRGISITRFSTKDVVRHPLVARIVEAYEKASSSADKK